MDWQEHFGNVFFETLEEAGLPHYHDFTDDYIKARAGLDFKNDWIQQSNNISPELETNLIRSIYGFGAFQGTMFGKMLKLEDDVIKIAADWCGRFNLGISLFDFLCDETAGGINRVTSLKVFHPFLNIEIAESLPSTPTEEFLSELVKNVLLDLVKLDSNNGKSNKSIEFFNLMKQLFEAQKFLSSEHLTKTTNLKNIREALYVKSAEPFRLMAEYTIGLTNTENSVYLKNACSIGRAIGHCYWVIDDAKDVWIDLEAKQWNLFLQLAAEEDPQIFSKNYDSSIKNTLINSWHKGNHVEKISERTVKRLETAINRLELSETTKEHTLGLLSASLWYWYQ